MTLANKITISRIVLIFAFMFFVFSKGFAAKTIALIVFLIASASDALDGYVARHFKQITTFGKILDPIADKLLVIAAFGAFVEMKLVPAWALVVVIFRELVITGVRLQAINQGKIISAALEGKHKTVSQIVCVVVVLVGLIVKEIGISKYNFWNNSSEIIFRNIIFTFVVITVIFTLTSGVSFFTKNRKIFKEE